MVACISPAYSSANHTINTLRYSDRLKEKGKTSNANVNQLISNNNVNNNFNKGVEIKSNKEEIMTKQNIERNIHSARVEKIKRFGKEEIKVKAKKDMVFHDNSKIIDESEVNN